LNVGLELAKLAAQFFGALVVARLAVGWALRRYKAEKTWERRLAAYVDALAALGEMRLVVGRWYDELITDRAVSDEQSAAQTVRYQAARRRLDEGVAVAALLLPFESSGFLAGLDRSLEASKSGHDQVDDLDRQYGVLDQAMKELTRQGREALGADFVPRPATRPSLATRISILVRGNDLDTGA
jgi:hypothetical protein